MEKCIKGQKLCFVVFFVLFSPLSKNGSGQIKSPVSASVCMCPPLITFDPIGGFSQNLVGGFCHSR
jgi:hypothetical protein